MVELTALEKFGELEKKVLGYENFQDCEEESYANTLDGLRQLVERVQRESLFSANEELKEIETDSLRLLLVPYYEAKVLVRMMTDRAESVKLGVSFFIEFLNLMKHYEVLTEDQK